ncbi:hypothetical protein HYFRA_00001113 [Hymenoscyphus fraxineus]|uniref:Uncharacterized protein n=1 Tax=Hymenoscyphus fraxineus TaxID=746836 RepID=A0A9N9KUQ4_9HELO|nr:hypothetical protein HYFRA_00001113 [Hymenoscyphus fraxineus]
MTIPTTTHFYIGSALVLTDLVLVDAGFHPENWAEFYLAAVDRNNSVDYFLRICVANIRVIFPESDSFEERSTMVDEFKEQLGTFETDEERFELFLSFVDWLEKLHPPITQIKETFLALLEKSEREDRETFEEGSFLIDIFALLRGQISQGAPYARALVTWLRGVPIGGTN